MSWLEGMSEGSKLRSGEDGMKLLKAIRVGAKAYQDFKY